MPGEFDKSIYINDISEIEKVSLLEYSRIYFGNEFCQFLFPGFEKIKKILDFAGDKGKGVSVVTPYMSDGFIYKIEDCLKKLWLMGYKFEVVVNDWGFFHLLSEKYPFCEIVLGRILSKMKRDPRIANLDFYQVPENVYAHYLDCNYSLPHVRDFLIKKGVVRVEFDNLLQGLKLDIKSPPAFLNNSLYYPYFYITTTRLCRFNDNRNEPVAEGIKFKVPSGCVENCRRNRVVFRQEPLMKNVMMVLQGNTLFGVNREINMNALKNNNINRIVVQKDLPMPLEH